MMINEKSIQMFLMLVVLLSIGLYIVISTFGLFSINITSFNVAVYHEISLLVKFVSIFISFIAVLLTLKSKFVVKFFLKDSYIAGQYKGKGEKCDDDNNIIYSHDEIFSIKQSLLSTGIEGYSIDDRGKKHAHWNGALVKVSNNRFSFMTEVETPHQINLDIMQFSFHEDEVVGFITASSSKSPGKWRLNAKKIS